MSKTLETLLKLSEKKLEDQRLVLSGLNDKKKNFKDEKVRLKKSIAVEIDASHNDIANFALAHNYASKANAGILYIEDQLIKLNKIIEEEKKILSDIFLQKKKQETLLDNYKKRKKAEYERKVQIQLDDLNSISYTNKNMA